MNRFFPGRRGGIVRAFLVLSWLFLPSAVLADVAADLRDCARIVVDAERLACYDALARPAASVAEPVEPDVLAAQPAAASSTEVGDSRSYLTRRWDMDENRPRGRFTIMPHRDNYLLPATYNGNHYQPAPDESYTVEEVKPTEAKYQISLKTKVWQDVLGSRADLWFGYTQQSFWQIYNVDESAPFRETDYEPELLLNYRADFNLLGLKLRTLTAGLNHQSNGRTQPMSRSWNRIVGGVGLERGNFTLTMKSWYRIPESKTDDDNRDLDDYMGPGEVQAYYLKNNHRFGVLARYNFRSENRGAVQVDWSYPLLEKIGVYVQYFNGYGENLLDYDQHSNRIGIGIILTDWN